MRLCHHRNVPLDRATSCSHCHRDMYRCDRHLRPRPARERPTTRAASLHRVPRRPGRGQDPRRSKACDELPPAAARRRTRVRVTARAEPGLAPGLQGRHARPLPGLPPASRRRQIAVADRYLSQCATCHRNEFADEDELRRRAPFADRGRCGTGPAATPTRRRRDGPVNDPSLAQSAGARTCSRRCPTGSWSWTATCGSCDHNRAFGDVFGPSRRQALLPGLQGPRNAMPRLPRPRRPSRTAGPRVLEESGLDRNGQTIHYLAQVIAAARTTPARSPTWRPSPPT